MTSTFVEKTREIILMGTMKRHILTGIALISGSVIGVGYMVGQYIGIAVSVSILAFAGGIIAIATAPWREWRYNRYKESR